MTAAAPAPAALIEVSVDFMASDFIDFMNGSLSAPYDPVSGSVVFTFDNATDIGGTSSGLTINSFSLPESYTPRYAYYSLGDVIIFSNTAEPSHCNVFVGFDHFCSFIGNASTNPEMAFFDYSSVVRSTSYGAASLNYDADVTAVPESSTWALMLLGFAGLGWVMRRKTKQSLQVCYV
jgi:hypothetical protein